MGREARAASQSTPEIVPFRFFVPIAKVDREKREVTGIVTQEILDKQGDIVDYETAKAFFTDDALWPGNMREMHQAKAVGKKVSVECDDANKTIVLTSRVSKGAPDTWEKVLDGTLSFYSIGGNGERVSEKLEGGGTAKRLFLKQLAETSYVDNGACPTAKFEIVKTVDGVLTDAEPPEPDPDPDPTPDPIAKAVAALDDATKAAATDDKNKTSSGKEGKEYAGTDGTSFPIAAPKDIANAARALGRTTQDKAKVKANIVRIAYKLGDAYVAKLPEAWKKTADQQKSEKLAAAEGVAKDGPAPYDVDGALQAISFVEHLLAQEMRDAAVDAAGAHDDGVEAAEVKLLQTAMAALLAYLQSEYEDQFDTDEPPDEADEGDDEIGLGMDATVEMFVKSLDIIRKAGARHSKADLGMIQQVHDLSGSLGAACKDADDAEKVAKAAAKQADKVNCDTCTGTGKIRGGKVTCPDCKGTGEAPAAAAKVVAAAPDGELVQKLTVALETTKAQLATLQATAAAQAQADAEVTQRLAALEAQPMPGGPARSAHAVEKTLGGPTETPPTTEVEEVSKVLDALAGSAASDEERMRIITKKLEYRRANGLDRIDPHSGRTIPA